jgi:cytochrome c peroxidase
MNEAKAKPARRPAWITAACVNAAATLFLAGTAWAEMQPVPLPAPVWQSIFARPPSIPSPAANPLTPEKIEFGRRLFFDKRLSGDGTRSCASCHEPQRAFTDGRVRAQARDGSMLLRNTPTLWNLAWSKRFHWDGLHPSLEAQARAPIEHPLELAGGSLADTVGRLDEDAELRLVFAQAFPGSERVTPIAALRALASFVRSISSPVTRFDRWIAGDRSALGWKEYDGFRLFAGKAGCLACHGGWRFTDDRFHDIGLPTIDLGRNTPDPSLGPSFKTPGLRGVAETAPYMHDGSIATLAAVVEHYVDGKVARPSLAAQLRARLGLSVEEREALVAFLRTL